MLYPSIDSLMTNINSKYTLVTVSARRAREIQDKKNFQLDKHVSNKYVGMALEEIKEGKLGLKRYEDAVE